MAFALEFATTDHGVLELAARGHHEPLERLRLNLAAERLSAQLTCKGASRTLLLSYKFLTHQPDPVLCQVCHRQEKVWWLCREGLVIRAFASHLRVYRDLREELLSPDRLVALGQTREAGQQLQALARDVRADCGTLRQELREAGKALVSLWPQKALAHLERLAEQNVAVATPFEQRLREVLADEDESTVEETLALYRRCAPLRKHGQRAEGWLAACFYLASFNSAAGGVGQASAGEVFGVSGATVSQRARAIQDHLPDTRPRRGWGAW